MSFDRVLCVTGTSGRVAATGGGTEDNGKHRRHQNLIQPDRSDDCNRQNPKHQAPNTREAPSSKLQSPVAWSLKFGASMELGAWSLELHFFTRSACVIAFKKSRSTSAYFFPTIDARATSTISTGRASSCWCNRKVSLSKRRARLRTTASPIFRLVITPTLLCPAGERSATFRIKQPDAKRWPRARVRAKSPVALMRLDRGKRRRIQIKNQELRVKKSDRKLLRANFLILNS